MSPNNDHEGGLFAAVVSVAAGLELNSTLRRIVRSAADLVDAEYGALGVLDEAGQHLEQFITVGMPEHEAMAVGAPPIGAGILGLLTSHPVPMRLSDLNVHPESSGMPAGHPPMQSFLGVPIRVRGELFGNLYLTQKRNDMQFTADDERAVSALAAAAGVAIENARLFEATQQAKERERLLALSEDRERIARDLHDLVIQRLFAVGMSLQTVLRGGQAQSDIDARVSRAIDDLDNTVKEIRQTIFALQHVDSTDSVRLLVTREVDSLAAQLGWRPDVRFAGPVDTLIPTQLHEQIVAVIREGITNVARHAQATEATVSLQASSTELRITITDNGVGIGDTDRRSGLANLGARARANGGELTLGTSVSGGTSLEWRVPLASPTQP